MATLPPVIISDDGSPPPLVETELLRVSRKVEFMQELTSDNGIHTIEKSTAIGDLTIIQKGVPPVPHSVNNTVRVLGDSDTLITVKMDSNKVVVITTKSLDEDFVAGFGRYAAKDTYIKKVFLDDSTTPIFTATKNDPRVRIEVEVS